jgi:hypothetical protein
MVTATLWRFPDAAFAGPGSATRTNQADNKHKQNERPRRLRRESQLGHASTDGEDTAVNQGASKLDNTIRLWPIPVVFDGVKPERMLLMSHQTRDAPAALESRCGGAVMATARCTVDRSSDQSGDGSTRLRPSAFAR